MKPITVFKAAAILAVCSSAWAVLAHSPNDSGGLPTKVRQSSLILYGEVVDIQYRNSDPTKEQPQGLPHTFVTYRVIDVLRGNAPSEKVTLRIPGGADGQGGIYMETTAPVFARRQTDVLFVRGGEIQDCPLVDCVEGRFRVHENQVFNGWGVPVVDAKEDLRIGGRARFDLNVMDIPRPPFEALLERPESKKLLRSQNIAELKARYEKEAPEFYTVSYGVETAPTRGDEFQEREAAPMERYGKPLSTNAFFDAIRTWSEQVGPPRSQVVNANPNQRFRVADPRLEAMKIERDAPPRLSEEERNDEKAREGDLQ